ncbi:hypothetical protein Gotur_028091 [Gossypium turneri]
MAILQNHWMVPDEILYRCGNFDWVPWNLGNCTHLLVLRQYRSRDSRGKDQGQ